jgi:hypothetical protein
MLTVRDLVSFFFFFFFFFWEIVLSLHSLEWLSQNNLEPKWFSCQESCYHSLKSLIS